MKSIRKVPTGGCHDCGGRCPYILHVEEGRVKRMEPHSTLRACVRGYAARQEAYSQDRLQQPLKRVGARGKGEFTAIGWDEALDIVALEMKRVKDQYGSDATLLLESGGRPGAAGPRIAVLFGKFGGCLISWGGPSAEGYVWASRATYGSLVTGNSRDDLVNSRMIMMWGWNPVDTIFSTGTSYQLVRAKEAGARIIGIDPRFTSSLAVFADQWIPIRPGTDTAMLTSMAYVLIEENLHDMAFLNKYTVGFEEYKNYVMGEGDSVPKTPEWAERITGTPAQAIRSLAREYARTKPAALITGYSAGRTASGEQFHRAAATLACMTGNVGISGGSSGGFENVLGLATLLGGNTTVGSRVHEAPGRLSLAGTLDSNLRNKTRVHWAKIWDAVLEGKAGGYPGDIKLLYVVGANPLNQCLDTNKGVEALRKLEFVVVHEQFMTPTARFADIVLPVSQHWATDSVMRPWYAGDYYVYGNKAIDSLPGTKSDYEISCELAARLGITGFPEKSPEEWQRDLVRTEPEMRRDIQDFDKFKKAGIWNIRVERPAISLRKQIEDPDANPFPTPSGKIEIFSSKIAELNSPDIPAVPKYIEDEPNMPDKYPLRLISFHHRVRAHSCFDNVNWLRRLEPQRVWINKDDARRRAIKDGGLVQIFNERGVVRIPAKVTERIMPGVVAIGEGGWYRPDGQGVDEGGCVNVLIESRHSPGGAFVSNCNYVEVKGGL